MQVWDHRHSLISFVGALVVWIAAGIVGSHLRFPTEGTVGGALLAAIFYYFNMRRYFLRRRWIRGPFPETWRAALRKHVAYYRRLTDAEKSRFERDIVIFLRENRITGVETEVDDVIRLLVAASAIMLIFGRPDWEYRALPEILIYPRSFDSEYKTVSHPRKRTLAGILVPQNAIVLASDQLFSAFAEPAEAHHVGLHEFAHALDMADNRAEGIPRDLDPAVIREWVDLMKTEFRKVREDRSVLDPYAGKNLAELFAVAVEHFFQRPRELKAQHSQLYNALSKFFHQDPLAR